MSISLRRDPRTVVPDIIEWFEDPFLSVRPFFGQAIKVEEYTADGRFVIRAELAGIDPEKDLEVSVSSGYLTIKAERSTSVEDKHRSEFRYGSLVRTLQLPSEADSDDITADYSAGILTIKVGLKGEPKEGKKIAITTSEK